MKRTQTYDSFTMQKGLQHVSPQKQRCLLFIQSEENFPLCANVTLAPMSSINQELPTRTLVKPIWKAICGPP